jgi:acyl-CoA synthetase (AMP-forming)/AMP-acid ligase II
MTDLLHELILRAADSAPHDRAIAHKGSGRSYAELAADIEQCSRGLLALGLQRLDRVAIYLPKQFETVTTMFGASHAGSVFVPVNPLLKPEQVGHILRDCNVRFLVTSVSRAQELLTTLAQCPDLHALVLTDGRGNLAGLPTHIAQLQWPDFLAADTARGTHRNIDADMAAILYTSGSTGRPKGVVLSHRNMVTGAESVAQYLGNTREDRLLSVLPFSFDYGFSQLSTAFRVGASVVLMDYQLADLPWPAGVTEHLRYITNSGGAMPGATLAKLRAALPKTRPFLMYGLTEAFRSTYLPPSEIDRRPDSIGKAIPNAEILVVRSDGSECAANEPGELVHRGSLVALGYWNDPAKTAELVLTEMAVWSGDTVRRDEEGFLYFIGRRDEMIKTSGYRVSPTEVEEVVFATGLVADAAAVGIPHPQLGQAIVVVAAPAAGMGQDSDALLGACKRQLPLFMVPHHIEWRETLPRNPNGKYDRTRLAAELKSLFAAGAP